MDLRRDVAREIARIYCRLSPSGIEALSEILVPFKYSKGDVVLPEGETCRHMYFVERGMVRQYYYKGGRDVTEHFSYEGRIVICIESFLKQEPSRLIVEALENSRLYGIPYDALQELADENKEIELLFRKIMEHALISMHKTNFIYMIVHNNRFIKIYSIINICEDWLIHSYVNHKW